MAGDREKQVDAPILRGTGVRKSYSGTRVLKDVDFEVRAGEVHALLGANGAGKSTLVKLIAGAERADAGSLLFDGQELLGRAPAAVQDSGVAVLHQELGLFSGLSVAENLAIRLRYPRRGPFISRRAARSQARDALSLLGEHGIAPSATIDDLRVADAWLVTIAASLARRPRLLVLDESTAALPESDARRLFDVLRERTRAGLAVLLVSHRMPEIRAVADRITVMKDGRVAGTVPSTTPTQKLVELMFGEGVAHAVDVVAVVPAAIGPPLLELDDVRTERLRGLTLSVRRGEIVGLAGALGSGRSEVARVLAGLTPVLSGTMRLREELYAPRTPRDALAAGVSLVPEHRDADGLMPGLSLAENVTVSVTDRLRRGPSPLLDRRAGRRLAAGVVERLHIVGRPDQDVMTLSGGNRQKALIGRALLLDADVVVLDEPTEGIDIASRLDLRRVLRRLAEEGKAVIVISSEFDELIHAATRIAVLRRGRVVDDDAVRSEQAIAQAVYQEDER